MYLTNFRTQIKWLKDKNGKFSKEEIEQDIIFKAEISI